MKEKRGDLQISFGFIFSVILIIIFVAFAFYVIDKFLETSDCGKEGVFKDDLQKAVDRAWNSQETKEKFVGELPRSIEEVCFVDFNKDALPPTQEKKLDEIKFYADTNDNLAFLSEDDGEYTLDKSCMKSIKIEHLDIDTTTNSENPFCIKKYDDKRFHMIIKKDFEDTLVKVEKI